MHQAPSRSDRVEVATTAVPIVRTPRAVEGRDATPVDVDAEVARAAAEARARAEGRRVVELSEVGEARVPVGVLRAALGELLGAAVALTPPASTIWLAAVPTRASVLLSIEDDAPARLAPAIDWLYDESPRTGLLDRPAVRACSHLARLSRVVAAAAGLAWIEEGVDGGACLVVELPVAGRALAPPPPGRAMA